MANMPRITPKRVITFLFSLVTTIILLVNHQLVKDVAHASLISSDTISRQLAYQLVNYQPKLPGADLQNRLIKFLNAPLLTYSDALAANMKTCGTMERADRQVNPDQLRQQVVFWRGRGNVELARKRLAIVQYLESVAKTTRPDAKGLSGGGRGIVMTAGNKDTAYRALVTLRILRKEYGCKLPVQIFSFPGEITDAKMLDEFESLAADVRVLHWTKAGRWKNFHIKAAAIVSSTFDEVLYLDSDNIPLRDPTYLFNSELYAGKGQPGVVFWPDLNKDHPKNAIWRLTGRTCDKDEWEVESGQILINKKGNDGLNLVALRIAAYMQQEYEYYFRLSEGDKDTFRYGFWILNLPYSVSPRYLSSLGFKAKFNRNRFCGLAMLQYDINPPPPHLSTSHYLPLFVHANLLKHRQRVQQHNGGGQPPSPFSTIKRFSVDTASSTKELDNTHMWVYQAKGMCVDMDVVGNFDDFGPGWEENEAIEEEFDQVYGGMFKNFTEIYKRNGGREGGW